MFAEDLLLPIKLDGEVEVIKSSGGGEKGWDPRNPGRGEDSVNKKVSAWIVTFWHQNIHEITQTGIHVSCKFTGKLAVLSFKPSAQGFMFYRYVLYRVNFPILHFLCLFKVQQKESGLKYKSFLDFTGLDLQLFWNFYNKLHQK